MTSELSKDANVAAKEEDYTADDAIAEMSAFLADLEASLLAEVEESMAPSREEMEAAWVAICEECFRTVDTDGSGYAEAGELKEMMRILGCPEEQLDAEVASALEAGDQDGDGRLSMEEMVGFFTAGRGAAEDLTEAIETMKTIVGALKLMKD